MLSQRFQHHSKPLTGLQLANPLKILRRISQVWHAHCNTLARRTPTTHDNEIVKPSGSAQHKVEERENKMLKNKNFLLRATSLLALVALLIGGAVTASAQKRKPKPKPRIKTGKITPKPDPIYSLAVGSKMRVRMDDTLTSKTAVAGDTFTTTLVDPVYANGVEVIPAGSKILGRVSAAKKAERKGKAGEIDVNFYAVRLPNGTNVAINGSLTGLDASNTESDNEGTARGDGIDNRKVIFIGGGAAGGAAIGAIAGGAKGAGIGAIAGAGAGIAGALLTKGPEAEVKPNTEFGVILNQAISLKAYK